MGGQWNRKESERQCSVSVIAAADAAIEGSLSPPPTSLLPRLNCGLRRRARCQKRVRKTTVLLLLLSTLSPNVSATWGPVNVHLLLAPSSFPLSLSTSSSHLFFARHAN